MEFMLINKDIINQMITSKYDIKEIEIFYEPETFIRVEFDIDITGINRHIRGMNDLYQYITIDEYKQKLREYNLNNLLNG